MAAVVDFGDNLVAILGDDLIWRSEDASFAEDLNKILGTHYLELNVGPSNPHPVRTIAQAFVTRFNAHIRSIDPPAWWDTHEPDKIY